MRPMPPKVGWLHPGARVVRRWRLACRLWRMGVLGKILARIVRNGTEARFGCYLSPTAVPGEGLFLPHPVGIVVGDGVTIGDHATLYQHVTIGRRADDKAEYPVIGKGATLYAGAVVAGPVTIGAYARIGANAVVLGDVPPEHTAIGAPARCIPPSR